ncbi:MULTISPECIES: FepA family TonB-dependent siderophore receptor [unclassified Rubrivivax]|uniref:FepA family TonB-dependent siderophore receptor n=1 Tax=unclassified Rubrivivax TaxID=2649762 RepID=UPI001E55D675|nr:MULTISPECIES: FepA family TonB-dependent siderophore receptor [unclassified Rubrivivax]MCC9596130.1 FepA family TonB-dependent siderophore receptor [Rubrivivax sp. JA1055]MCC9647528.1 FepA family TonB-dependent siderophore receptor [Rubrivivax sp. JA1029]
MSALIQNAPSRFAVKRSVSAVSLALLAMPLAAQQAQDAGTLKEVRAVATAEEELRQSLGVSVITDEDLARKPPANDLADILRTQPGVNLTGNSASGAYGNQRQIDLRGMGPENTLILVDGKPVMSRTGTQMRRNGERDTGGDTNWVPVDQIERIEVIRGPAAARYGSGAAGGVINIITKKPAQTFGGSITAYKSVVDDGGNTKRLGFSVNGPISENLSFRVYGNVAKTDEDSATVNTDEDGNFLAAGREGRRNRDVNGLLRWQATPDQVFEFESGFSRQGNIYTGESVTGVNPTEELIGDEVRRVYRQTAAVTHKARWGDLGDSRIVLQYEDTRTANCRKGSVGGTEGNCSTPVSSVTSDLRDWFLNAELHTPLTIGEQRQVLTTGFEYRSERLDDPNAIQTTSGTLGDPAAAAYRVMEAKTAAFYVEDNIGIGQSLVLTPGLRLDHHDQFGNNWSPSLNASFELSPQWMLKGGIARVFKAPNLYQTNPYYYWQSMGGGCPSGFNPCQIRGNENLDAEISVNKEIGVAWAPDDGWDASLTYFRNDYKNKIGTALGAVESTQIGTYWVTQWLNLGPALVHGLEGSLSVPLMGPKGRDLKLVNNVTWMFSNKSKDTDQPISIIPKYTLNSTLDWRANDQFSAQLIGTFYGRQAPRTVNQKNDPATAAGLKEQGSYSLFEINGSYAFDKHQRVSFGVTNLFDKIITRESSSTDNAGAATYNEPGRGFYVSYSAKF